jgi:2-deoxy-D-gluconate 3-dehydrogenase
MRNVAPLFDLTGKTALVTGASSGIGQSIAVALAAAGADIIAVSRSEPVQTATAVREVGARFAVIAADLSVAESIAQVIEAAYAHAPSIDILINNAGIIRRNDALDFTAEDWDAVLAVNLRSVFFLTQGIVRRQLQAGARAKVVNIASLLSFQGGMRVASYTASKSGLAGLTRLLANEWAARGVNVNAIAPGYIETGNTEALRQDAVRNRQILERIPAGRWGRPEDLAGAVVFLASAASDYVHGAVLPVDGGWLAR